MQGRNVLADVWAFAAVPASMVPDSAIATAKADFMVIPVRLPAMSGELTHETVRRIW